MVLCISTRYVTDTLLINTFFHRHSTYQHALSHILCISTRSATDTLHINSLCHRHSTYQHALSQTLCISTRSVTDTLHINTLCHRHSAYQHALSQTLCISTRSVTSLQQTTKHSNIPDEPTICTSLYSSHNLFVTVSFSHGITVSSTSDQTYEQNLSQL
jgi:hypothetical protein